MPSGVYVRTPQARENVKKANQKRSQDPVWRENIKKRSQDPERVENNLI